MKKAWLYLNRFLPAFFVALSVGASFFLVAGAMAQAPKDATPAAPAAVPAQPAPAVASPAAVPAQPAPPAGGPGDMEPARQVIENPYGIEALWKQGDFVARGTLITLIIMSIGSWYIGIVKYIEQARVLKDASEADEKFWKAKSMGESIFALREDSPFRFIAEKGAYAAEHHGNMPGQRLDMNTWVAMTVQRAIDVVSNRLQRGLAFLATVGSTAPFVGLFGTVWGIYHALTAIGIAGQASIDKVAGPVGEALIMTALGLAVAVPAVLGYNWMVRRNKVAMELVRHFGGGVHMTLLGPGARRGS
jgi:biopolymer transport protein ExbB